MKKYIGGYSILDLTDANVSAQANACYNQDKPVLVYGANGERYFADTITKSGTSIIITKGGKTITIANDNTITSEGDIQNHLWSYTICLDSTDYGFTINLPFDLGTKNVTINDDDSLNENKDFIQKLIDLIGVGSSIMFEGYSDNTSKCFINANIRISSKLEFYFTNVAFSDGNESFNSAKINLTNGKVTSFDSGEFQIIRNYQIY